MKKRGYLEISFAWLFALIVGAFILFLAIYFAINLIYQGQQEQDAQTGKNIGILLNPLETGFQDAVSPPVIDFPAETRIYASCQESGEFGTQYIKISQKSFGKWTDTNIKVPFQNKYIFAEYPIEGKKFMIFSKPFEMPFKIADLVYMVPLDKKYCFKDAPEEIESEISALSKGNLFHENCTESMIDVCFSSGSCDVKVNYQGGNFEKEGSGYVEKKSSKMFFEGDALMYSAIFSDEETYECNLIRLMKRLEKLASLYSGKADFIAGKCDTNIQPDLESLSSSARTFDDSSNLGILKTISESVKDKNNDNQKCKLW